MSLTKNKPIPDIPSAPPKDTTPESLSKYEAFLNGYRTQMAYNAQAYVNQHAMADTNKSQLLKKVVYNAAFLPAHETRYAPGVFAVEKMKYFVIHRPSLDPAASSARAMMQTFSEPDRQASTHFIIDFAGNLIQMVDLADMAYHTGDSKKAHNGNSVGVELEGEIGLYISNPQYEALAKLIRTLNGISGFLPAYKDKNFAEYARQAIVGHSEIRPGEKVDPGPNFNYNYLISLIPKVTVPNDAFKTAFDIREQLETSLNAIARSFTPQNEGQAAHLNVLIQKIAAEVRIAGLTAMGSGTLPAWAAETAQKLSVAISEEMRAHMEQKNREDAQKLERKMDPKVLPKYYNFTTGEYVDGIAPTSSATTLGD